MDEKQENGQFINELKLSNKKSTSGQQNISNQNNDMVYSYALSFRKYPLKICTASLFHWDRICLN